MFSLSPAVLGLAGTERLTLTRATIGYVDGVATTTATEEIEISALVAELTGAELRRGEDGGYETGAVQVFTTGEPLSRDTFEWHGATYEVDKVEDWSSWGYRRAVATRSVA